MYQVSAKAGERGGREGVWANIWVRRELCLIHAYDGSEEEGYEGKGG